MLTNDNTNDLGHVAVVAGAKITRAKNEVKDAQSGLKDEIKWAKNKGVDVKALEYVLNIRKSGKTAEVVEFMNNVMAYFKAFGDPIQKAQIEMFRMGDGALPIEEQAYADGNRAGLWDEGSETSPHDLGSQAGQAWMTGWHDGQDKRAKILTATTDSELIKAGGDAADPFPDFGGTPADGGGEA